MGFAQSSGASLGLISQGQGAPRARVRQAWRAVLRVSTSVSTKLTLSRLMHSFLPFHSLSIASVTGTNPSPNKRGLHCLSVLLTDTDRMDAAST
jgi:hypothetical protein